MILYFVLTAILAVYPYLHSMILVPIEKYIEQTYEPSFYIVHVAFLLLFAALLYCFATLPIRNRWVAIGCHAGISALYLGYYFIHFTKPKGTYAIIIIGFAFCLAAMVGDLIKLLKAKKNE